MKIFGHLFSHAMYTQNGEPITLIWVGNKSRSILINPDSTRIFASLWQDGCGKFHPTIYASLLGTLRIRLREHGGSFGLRSFPLFTVWPPRYKCSSMTEAQKYLQEYLVEMRMI
jgi:hypothetical protein